MSLRGFMFEPVCVVHGPMRFKIEGCWFLCNGWDGSPCCALSSEQVADNPAAYARVRPSADSHRSIHGYVMAIPEESPAGLSADMYTEGSAHP